MKWEERDLDICQGHSTGLGEYHHHNYSPCLKDLLGDDGLGGHSPVVGFAADGYPIHGLYQKRIQSNPPIKAKSCWKKRNYLDPNDPLGCGGTGKRACKLIDEFQPSLGTELLFIDDHGPDVGTSCSSASGSTVQVDSGVFYEDYYYSADCTTNTPNNAGLDSHNGHNHPPYGYHYHLTEDFPYSPGPKYFGKIHGNTFATV